MPEHTTDGEHHDDETGNSKNASAAVAALMPCISCGSSAMERLGNVQFVKGSKKAVLPGGICEECLKLVSFCKKGKGTRGAVKKKAGKDELPPELVAAMAAAKAKKGKKNKTAKTKQRNPVMETTTAKKTVIDMAPER